MPKVKAELDRMKEMGVIEPVDNPTEWCSPMVPVPKPNGKVRICGDFIKLNKGILRDVHPIPPTEQSLGKLAANSGFWQIKLAEKSKLLTTFITPWGRYCFSRLPFGVSCAPEHFQKTMEKVLEDLPGVVLQVDDILVHGETQQEHDTRLEAVLQRLVEAGITLNPDKCLFAQETVPFLGHLVGKNGIAADPKKIAAIKEMTAPTDIPSLRRFLGIVNQMGKYIPNLAEKSQPLRELQKKENTW